MNRLLKKHRVWLALTIIIQALGGIALIVCWSLFPTFPYYFYIAFAYALFVIFYDFVLNIVFNGRFAYKKGQSDLKASEIIGADFNDAYNFGEIGVAVCDNQNIVLRVNDFLGKRFDNLIDQNIYSAFPALTRFAAGQDRSPIRIDVDNYSYDVQLIPDSRLFVFRDVTDFATIYKYNNNQSPVVGYVVIDNYNDVQDSFKNDIHLADSITRLQGLISTRAENFGAWLRPIRDDRFFFITTKEDYLKMVQDKFSVVDKVRKEFPNLFTISIGIGLGFPDYSRLAEMASSALDVALSRGGDQTVVFPFGQPMRYFGGKSELLPSRNRVKIRTVSNSFASILRNYRQIVVRGHSIADFDAIGSCLAVYRLCQIEKIPCKICWEDQLVEDKARIAVESSFNKKERDETFVSRRDVSSLISNHTLLVLVDHSDPRRSIFPEQTKKFDHIAVIDHHRLGSVMVNNAVFSHIDTSASSASEILTSFFRYNQKDIKRDARTATFLLTGISLDTHNFKEHTTEATFEAAAALQTFGASNAKSVNFLKDDFDDYRLQISILNHSETPYYGTVVSLSPDDDIVSSVTLSKVANRSINLRGVSLSFAIGRTSPHEIKISARSDGTVNCQSLREKLGGGGHLIRAAAVFTDRNVDDVKKKLYHVLDENLDSSRVQDESDTKGE